MKTSHILAAASLVLPTALAWGAAGHEIVATIAQIHLHPEVRDKLCTLLPPEAKCHLAPVAAWADTVRRQYPATGPMHYVNPKLDHPGDHCTFGEHGWVNEDVNVLTAIMNKTQAVIDSPQDIDLRFLIHFLGDIHQPLHLTGRDRGGNNALFLFEGRIRSLHSVWDSGIITKNIRELGNYTTQLPSRQIEDNLLGAIFDPYVRWIVWEGIKDWWRDDLESWLACPEDGDPYPHSSISGIPASRQASVLGEYANIAAGFLPHPFQHVISGFLPLTAKERHDIRSTLLANHPSVLKETGEKFKEPACPYTWAKAIHGVNCEYAWPLEYNETAPRIELDTPKYLGKIGDDKVVESLLAKGGLRLAKVLNEALGGGELSSLYFGYN